MAGERILVVDDEPGVRSALEGILADEGFQVTCAGSGEDGLSALAANAFDAVLLDVWLPGMDGIETLMHLRERNPDTEVVMISGHGTIDTAVRATKLGAFDFIEKPLSLEKTLLVLRNALRQRRLEHANRRLLAQLAHDTEIIGHSAAAEKLRKQVEIAAQSDAPVLISGEPGSGRENVARGIHTAGRVGEAPFVEVPFGAQDAAAAEAALFGEGREPSRIKLATSGSLFLENVDRLSPPLQRRLASAIKERADEGPAPRVMASVAPDLAGLDPELRNRLDVIRIAVPSLRERRDDIPGMAERFMQELSREYGREPKRLTPDCLAALKAHDWPGEVGELRNLMERLLLLTSGDVVRAQDLPQGAGSPSAAGDDLYGKFESLQAGLSAFERYYTLRIVAEEGADIETAAGRLGMTPATLKKKLKKMQ